MTARREPERTCVGCRERSAKGELIRIAVAPDGFRVDRRGTMPGRGAYVHPVRSCVDDALGRGSLARALRTVLDRGGAARLRTEIEREIEGD